MLALLIGVGERLTALTGGEPLFDADELAADRSTNAITVSDSMGNY